jgi:hypothetical protein
MVRNSWEAYSSKDINHRNPCEGTRGVKPLRDEGWRLLALQGEELKVGTTLRSKPNEAGGVALKPLLVA